MRRIAVIAVVLLAAGCRPADVTLLSDDDLPEDVYRPSPTPSPADETPSTGMVYMVRDERLVSVEQRLPAATTAVEALLSALLEGTGSSDAQTAIPDGTRLLDVGVVGGVATVDLSQEFEQGGAGRLLALRVAQVVFTLTGDPEVDSVLFLIEGNQVPVIAADERRVLERPVNRADYRPLAPQADEPPS